MARTVRNAKTDTRSARAKLAERREPYWTVISAGCAIGYRRGAKGGTWIARFRADDGKQHYESLGAADDARDPDGLTVFSFQQAQERARGVFARKARELAGDFAPSDGPYTVAKALDAYFAERERRGSKGLAKDKAAANVRILPDLGDVEISKLTTKRLRDWQAGLATAPKLTRTGRMTRKRKAIAIDKKDADAVRARRSTANRTLTVLKAALNHSFHEGRIISDDAWRKVKSFREVDAAVVHFLSEDECRRLVNACDGAFRDLVRAALLTGCRYGELTRMRASDFGIEAGTITVRESKAGKPRHVAITDEGRAHFERLTAGKAARDPIFVRDDGNKWAASHQQRPLADASKRAKIAPAATFHILRHTYASTLAMRGVPMGVIAAQLGHADTRMTEKHYAHLAPNYVAQMVRASFPSLGIIQESNIAPLRRSKSGGDA
ncbi:site-specific integrase [Methylocystis sp.]|uniref:tyrosine-type recombinase/integrase n=1 Tax=Methylocystis sp. TaxID=1911079 RepID=UPI0027359166|nr:site-specific integrase [Methylocystis sp.]MDP3552647.1 site-specific integrase [Methylocystis sp.]